MKSIMCNKMCKNGGKSICVLAFARTKVYKTFFISFHLSLYYKIYRHIIRVTLHEWIYNIMLFTFILQQLVN